MNILAIKVYKKICWLAEYTFEDSSTKKIFIDEVLTLREAVVKSINNSGLELTPDMFATSDDWGGWAIWESGPPDIYIKELNND